MNLWTTTIAASCLLAGIAPQDPAGRTFGGKLIRVAPAQQADPLARSELEVEDLEGWRKRLSAEDLDERERAFDELVAAAQRQPALQQALEEWSRDAADPDLAWSARLALREMRAGSMH